MSIKYDHQDFEDGLFVHLPIIIALHCVICLKNHHKTIKSNNKKKCKNHLPKILLADIE